jgi:hypothetical protein
MPPSPLPDVPALANLGVAGLMGSLWWLERRYARQREDQLTQAHNALLAERERLGVLIATVTQNTKVIERFTGLQEEMVRLLRRMGK